MKAPVAQLHNDYESKNNSDLPIPSVATLLLMQHLSENFKLGYTVYRHANTSVLQKTKSENQYLGVRGRSGVGRVGDRKRMFRIDRPPGGPGPSIVIR